MRERTERIIRTVAWAGAVLLLVVLALRDIGPGRTKVFDARLDAETPTISMFGPPSRVERADGALRVVGEPVYVDLRIPRWFRAIHMELAFENPHAFPISVGVRTHPTHWSYQLTRVPDPTGEGVAPEGVQAYRVPIALNPAWQTSRNTYQLIVAAPGASDVQPIVIRGFRVVAERDAICVRQFCL